MTRTADRPRWFTRRLAPASRIAVVGLALLVVTLALACDGGGADEGARGDEAAAPSVLWFAQADGTVAARVSDGGSDRLPAPPLPGSFATQPTAGGRQLAYDGAHQRLWYSDDHARILSIDLELGTAGPQVGPFSDVALWGCSVGGRARTFAIDGERNRMLVSSLGGGVLAYDLDDFELVGAIGPTRFGDVAFDFRRLAIDAATDTLWFSTYTGAVAALDLESERLTGATVETGGQPWSIAIDEGARRLLVLGADDLQVVNLATLEVVREAAPPGAVALTSVSRR